MATDLTTLQAAVVVDCRGSACPGPLMEAKKAIGRVKVGEVLEVLSNDPGTKERYAPVGQESGPRIPGLLAPRRLRPDFRGPEEVNGGLMAAEKSPGKY